jgi:hypothetical protein
MTLLTHKEWDTYYAHYEHDYDPADVPRDPGEYHPWLHFIEELQQPDVSADVIEDILREGDVYPGEGKNRYRFLWTAPDLRTYVMVVQLDPDAVHDPDCRHAVVTIYRFTH